MARNVQIFVAVCWLFLAPAMLYADGPSKHEETMQEISASIMSPFCPGRLLVDCPSSSATELRHNILERLNRGESRAEIEEALITVYGEAMRAAPRAEGFGLVAWVAPFFLLVVGFLFVVLWLRGKRGVEDGSTVSAPSEEMRERIENLLK